MIKQVEMFTVICDNCGKDCNKDTEYSCWNSRLSAEDVAIDSDWIKEKNNHYCSDCYWYDDNDNLILKDMSHLHCKCGNLLEQPKGYKKPICIRCFTNNA